MENLGNGAGLGLNMGRENECDHNHKLFDPHCTMYSSTILDKNLDFFSNVISLCFSGIIYLGTSHCIAQLELPP